MSFTGEAGWFSLRILLGCLNRKGQEEAEAARDGRRRHAVVAEQAAKAALEGQAAPVERVALVEPGVRAALAALGEPAGPEARAALELLEEPEEPPGGPAGE